MKWLNLIKSHRQQGGGDDGYEIFPVLADRALSEVQHGAAKLSTWLPVVIAFDDALASTPAIDPLLDNAIRRAVMERGISENPWRPVLERALDAAKNLQCEVGPPKSRGRPLAAWLFTARILAPEVANVLERSGIHSSPEHAEGPLIKVLAQAVKAATGKTVANEALSAGLGRHPPFKRL